MAIPNTNWTEIITTTLFNRSKKLADNVTKANALLFQISKKGRMKPVDGGTNIIQELEYAENGTYTRYSGYDILNVSPSDVFTAAQYNFAQAAVAVSISGLEELQNAGEERVINLLESRIGNAERTMRNNISADCYSDGTASGGKQIGGLALLVPDANTSGTVGGIDRATWTFWQTQKQSFATDGFTAGPSTIQTEMNRLWLKQIRQADRPDLIIADNNYYRYYLESLQAIQRIASEDKASAGFMSLKFMDADVVCDGTIYGGGATANHMWFLNTDYIFFRPHKDRNMVPLDPRRFSVNQDAMVQLIAFAGNMTLSNAALQGVLIA